VIRTLYLIRHGHPQQNTGIAYDRAPGPPLDQLGRDEARAAGLFLASLGIGRLYVSPLERTVQTAAEIATVTRIPTMIEPALAEHRSDEPFDAVKTRVRELFARLDGSEDSADPALETLGFVTHGSPIKALLQILSNEQINLSSYSFPGGNHAPTAGVWRARWDRNAWTLALVFEPKLTLT
jgi:broad specificity phosphatase PhoE